MSVSGLLLAVTMFKMTPAHLQFLRHSVALWSPVESGAPAALVSPLLVDNGEKLSDATQADIAKGAGLAKVDKAQIDQLLQERGKTVPRSNAMISSWTAAPLCSR